MQTPDGTVISQEPLTLQDTGSKSNQRERERERERERWKDNIMNWTGLECGNSLKVVVIPNSLHFVFEG